MWVRTLRRLLAVLCLAGLPHSPRAAQPEAISNRVFIHYDVQADGTSVRTVHLERKAGTDSEARSMAVLTWQYDPRRSQVDIEAAYTLKADGSKLMVDPAMLRDQPVQGPGMSPLSGGLQQKLIRFPGVTNGDSVVVDLRERDTHPLLPGVFSVAVMYDQTQLWDARVSISVPARVKLLADAVGPVGDEVSDGAEVTYGWNYHSANFRQIDIAMLAPIARLPRLIVTSAPDWQQISRDYDALILPMAAVTDRVDDTAEEATHGLTDRRSIAEHLCAWVAANIAYAPGPPDEARVVPRPADAVLTTKSGDSADQATLLAALLKAKAIPSELALVPFDNVYRLSVPAPFEQLNHALVYLPDFGVYADPTAGPLPFGLLPLNDYGKPVVYANAAGQAAGMIPPLAPGVASSTYTTTAHLTADDQVIGDSRTEATGPFELVLRRLAAALAKGQSEQVADALFQALGERGSGRFDPPPAASNDAAAPFALTGHFSTSVWPLLSASDHLKMPTGMRVLARPGDLLIGPLDATDMPASEPTPCYPGHQVSTVSLDLGPKYQVLQLPADRNITNDAFSYQSHWSEQGQIVTVTRDFVSRVTAPLCSGKLREEAAAALHEIQRDYAETVALRRTP